MSDDSILTRLRSGALKQQFKRPSMAVLFIDPDTATAERLARALKDITAVAVVPTVQAARAAMKARTPNLIVMDLDVPDGNAIEFIAQIHNAPDTRNVLVIVLTARTNVQDKIAAFQAGADDYLVKPVEPQQFATHVQLVSRFRQVIGNTATIL